MPNEIEEYDVRFRVGTFGKKEQVKKAAVRMARDLRVQGYEIKEAYLNGELYEPFDYQDDEGEMYHTLDWKKEKVNDEGRGNIR